MQRTFTFRIAGAYSPDSIPLERLGEYLEALGEFLGDTANVHFGGLEHGSTVVRAIVEEVAAQKVDRRVRRFAAGDASPKARKAFAKLDNLLFEDNATGSLQSDGANVIRVDFEGKDRPDAITYGPIRQLGTLDGVVHRVEGSDKTVHIGISDGPRTYALEAPASMGHELAQLFRNGTYRFRGEGTWLRKGTGEWELRRFKLDSVEKLDDRAIPDLIEDLRKIGPGDWGNEKDPLASLLEERDEGRFNH